MEAYYQSHRAIIFLVYGLLYNDALLQISLEICPFRLIIIWPQHLFDAFSGYRACQ